MLKVSLLVMLILVNTVHFGKGLAADRNHRRPVDEQAATDVGDANKQDMEAIPSQYASHTQGSIAMYDSTNHSGTEEPVREASDKLSELTVANRSLSRIHKHESTNASVSKSSNYKTAANLNVSSTEHTLNDSIRNTTSDSTGTDSMNYSQTESIMRATLCANGSAEKETMRVEVEFASTLLENGLYYFINFNKNNEYSELRYSHKKHKSLHLQTWKKFDLV